MTAVFLVVALTSFVTYLALSAWLEHRDGAAALRRLGTNAAVKAENRRAAKPVLIEVSEAMRGRMTGRLLEGLRLKLAAERLLETAALKWGAAGFLHRSVAVVLVTFFGLFVWTGNALVALAVSLVAGLGPLWYVKRKARQRVRRFEEQFPAIGQLLPGFVFR